MRTIIATLIILFIFKVPFCCFGQASFVEECNLYTDHLTTQDTIRVSINFFINRSFIQEQVLIYKNGEGNYFAILESDSLSSTTIRLDSAKLNMIKSFEMHVRQQGLVSNTTLYIHALAEYQIQYRQGYVGYSTKKEFYSLCNELLMK